MFRRDVREKEHVVNIHRRATADRGQADWREDDECETENARQELSTRAARVYRYTSSRDQGRGPRVFRYVRSGTRWTRSKDAAPTVPASSLIPVNTRASRRRSIRPDGQVKETERKKLARRKPREPNNGHSWVANRKNTWRQGPPDASETRELTGGGHGSSRRSGERTNELGCILRNSDRKGQQHR